MTLQKMALTFIIKRATSRHLREIAEGFGHKLICDTCFKNAEQCITVPLSLLMVVNLFGHNKFVNTRVLVNDLLIEKIH